MQLIRNTKTGLVHRPELGTVARPGHMFTEAMAANTFSWCGRQVDDPDGPYETIELNPRATPFRLCKICFHVMP